MMAHLLMIESWVGASGNLLPPLLRSMGHTYTFVTRNPEHYQKADSADQHPVVFHADSVLVTETNDLQGLIEFVRPLRFDGVITICDYYIDTVREVAKAYALPCPFPQDVREVRHKHLMRKALDQAGLPNPDYRLAQSWSEVQEAAAAIGYPLVMKPVDLASSAFVSLIQTEDELKSSYQQLEDFPLNFRDQPRDRTYLLEAFMVGEEVSVESVSCHGETSIIGITDKSITGTPYFIENGHMFPAKLRQDIEAEVKQFVQEALKAVHYDHGIAHTEVKLTKEGPRIVEINPRTAGNYIVELIQRVTDLNLLEAFVDLSLGKVPNLTVMDNGIQSAAVMFLVPPHSGMISQIKGLESLDKDERIVRYKFDTCDGKAVSTPIDNACYLGHVIAQDLEGRSAREYAEEALHRIQVHYEDMVKS